MYTANVCMAGTDGIFNSMGKGMIVNFDGVPLASGNGVPDEIITAEVRRNSPTRRGGCGASRTTSISSATAASSRSKAARRIAPTATCRIWSPANTGCRGRTRSR